MPEFQKVLKRLMGKTPPVVVAGRMTEAGYKTSEAAVYAWVNGTRAPHREAIPYLARALNVTPNDLLGFEEVA